jgi:hypothetical protein
MFRLPPVSTAAARRVRLFVSFVVVALVLVPALVRATHSFDGDATKTIRLNRGFDAPESKCRVAPPASAAVHIAVLAFASPTDSIILVPTDESRPVAIDTARPRTPRGPPSTLARA